MLLAAPGMYEEEWTSPTWSMIRYVWRHSVRVVVLNPEAGGPRAELLEDKVGKFGISGE
jgi:hypothetical protein